MFFNYSLGKTAHLLYLLSEEKHISLLQAGIICCTALDSRKDYFSYVICVQRKKLYHKLYSLYCFEIKHDEILWKDSETAVGSDHIRCAEQELQCTHAKLLHCLGIPDQTDVSWKHRMV